MTISWIVELYREYTDGNESVQESVQESEGIYLRKRQIDILYFCLKPRKSKEILDYLGVINHSKNRKLHITELVQLGLLARTIPENPNDRNQKYITTKAGKLYIEENDNRGKTR